MPRSKAKITPDGADAPQAPEAPDVSASKPAPTRKPRASAPALIKPARGSKTDTVIAMMRRPEGVSVDELMAATGWQRHSVRGALAGPVKKKIGAVVTSAVTEGVRRYYAPGVDQ